MMPDRDFLLLRLEAPLMAFGGPMVDQIGRTRDFPGAAQITGLLGNALGYRHQDADALGALQRRLRMAAALVRPGERLRDYQTVDLGQPHLQGTGWTTRGVAELRGGASGDTTHIRHRWYLADARVLVALTLVPADDTPGLADLARALAHPARPLFIGRKPCLPTAPILLGTAHAAADATAALRQAARLLAQADPPPARAAREPAGNETEIEIEIELDEDLAGPDADAARYPDRLIDRRDWRNQMHTGERRVHRLHRDLGPGPRP